MKEQLIPVDRHMYHEVQLSLEAPPHVLAEYFRQVHELLGSPDVVGDPEARLEVGYSLNSEQWERLQHSDLAWFVTHELVRVKRVTLYENAEPDREYCEYLDPAQRPDWAEDIRSHWAEINIDEMK
jgi:hypothetical protein